MIASRRGYTFVELFVVMALIGLLLLIGLPKVGRGLQSSRVDRAASLVALTLERSFTLASRQRQPVVVACEGTTVTCPGSAIEIRNADTPSIIYQHRSFGTDTEFQLDSMSLSQAETIVTPHGIAIVTTPPLQVTLYAGASSRVVTMSTAGQVRVVR